MTKLVKVLLFFGAFFSWHLVLSAKPQQTSPTSESIELSGITLRLGMAQDLVTNGLREFYNLQEIGTATSSESSWMVETKSGPPTVAVASVTFVGGGLSSVYKYWTPGNAPGTDAGIAGTLYGAVTRFQQEIMTPCEVTTNSSKQPDGELRTVLVTCKGRQKYLSIDIVPMDDGKERVSLAEVLKYPSEDIHVPQEMPSVGSSEIAASSSSSSTIGEHVVAEKRTSTILRSTRSQRTMADRWYPQDVDEGIPQVAQGTSCPLSDVLSRAAKRTKELVENVDKFTATEIVEHQSVDKSGRLRNPEIRKFEYLVSIAQTPSGYLNVEEYRNGGSDPDVFPDHVATVGTPSLVMIFHPAHSKDFSMQCEGLGQWQGKPAWQIRFEERKDARHRMSVLAFNGRAFGLRLRGRAWILRDSDQIARLESDLAEEIPEAGLRLQHEDIEYNPVHFKAGVEMWLPSICDYYMDFRGHRFYRRHRFTDFQLFSVKLEQTSINPKE